MKETTEEDHPIHWYDRDNAHWRNYGEMSDDKHYELFGIDGELELDEEDAVLIGSILFTDNLKSTREKHGNLKFDGIRTLKQLGDVNITLLRELTKDINDYYERMKSKDWSNIPDWKSQKELNYEIF